MLELVKHLSTNTPHKAVLICLSEHVEYPYVYDLPIVFHVLKRKFKKDPSVFFTLYRIIRQEKPDLLHSWSSMANILTLPIAKMLRIRFLTSVIADAPKDLTYRHKAYFRARLIFPFADKITSNSLAGLEAYRAPVKKSSCIYNGFDGKRLSSMKDPSTLRAELGIGNGAVIGMVAGFEDRKDYATLIEAATAVLKKKPDTVFLFIGEGYTKKAMMQLVPASCMEKIRFLGRIDNVESYINIFDIGVLCTNANVHQEGISNSIMEYMALEKPVVATEGGGTNEIVLDQLTGFLVPAYDASSLSEKLLQLMENPEMRKKFGKMGFQRIQDFFSIDKMCAQFYSLYDEMIEN